MCAQNEAEARRQLAPVHVMYENLARGDLRSPMLDPDAAVRQLGALPRLAGEPIGAGEVVLDPATITFLAMPEAENAACR